MPFTGQVFEPHQFEVVQAIFKTIVAEPWFDRSKETEKEFATFILQAYREGITDTERLENYCREAAALLYSR